MKAEPCTYVIFGATGNLSRIKLMPALYHLDAANRLPEGTRILAIGRRPWDQQKWLAEVRQMIQAKAPGDFDETVFQRFSARLYYHQGDITQPQCYSGTGRYAQPKRPISLKTSPSIFPSVPRTSARSWRC